MKNRWVFALSMAVLWGIVFVYAMDNVITSICMGLLMGTAFGLFDGGDDTVGADEDRRRHEDSCSKR